MAGTGLSGAFFLLAALTLNTRAARAANLVGPEGRAALDLMIPTRIPLNLHAIRWKLCTDGPLC